jgi:hypothetical protein
VNKATASLCLALSLAAGVPGVLLAPSATQPVIAKEHLQAIPFQKAEAPVTGTVTVHTHDGVSKLVFSNNFSTNPQAPDLQVVLVRSATPLQTLKPPAYALAPGSYTQVAALRSPKGPQTYTLPKGVDLKAYGSVLIWCRTANATMAWAALHGHGG